MRNGIGTYTYDDGTVFEGLWQVAQRLRLDKLLTFLFEHKRKEDEVYTSIETFEHLPPEIIRKKRSEEKLRKATEDKQHKKRAEELIRKKRSEEKVRKATEEKQHRK